MQKSKRHQLIIDLIGSSKISKQKELVDALSDNGFSVTQASVSRDLEELGIAKRNGKYVREIRNSGGLSPFGVITFTPAGSNLIIARCGPGMASALAVKLDSAAIDGLIGTIAGDDTVFLAIDDEADQRKLMRSLKEEFHSNEG